MLFRLEKKHRCSGRKLRAEPVEPAPDAIKHRLEDLWQGALEHLPREASHDDRAPVVCARPSPRPAASRYRRGSGRRSTPQPTLFLGNLSRRKRPTARRGAGAWYNLSHKHNCNRIGSLGDRPQECLDTTKDKRDVTRVRCPKWKRAV